MPLNGSSRLWQRPTVSGVRLPGGSAHIGTCEVGSKAKEECQDSGTIFGSVDISSDI